MEILSAIRPGLLVPVALLLTACALAVRYDGAAAAKVPRKIVYHASVDAPSPAATAVRAPAASAVPVPVSGAALDHGVVGKVVQMQMPGEVMMNFCYCPAGSFVMGSPVGQEYRQENEDQVTVRLSRGYWMGQTELTQRQWTALVKDNPSYFQGDDLPVESVSWEEADAFIAALNERVSLPAGWKYALPTEAQWEYACRAGTKSAFSFGASPKQLARYGNFADKNFTMKSHGDRTQDDGVGDTTSNVGQYRANPWGLHDMHGNVLEWCADWYVDKLAGGTDPPPAPPPTGDFTFIPGAGSPVVRGGSWASHIADCTAFARGWGGQNYRTADLDFRPALVPSNW